MRTPSSKTSNLSYVRQFDGLRAVAVGLVLASHWTPMPLLPWGQIGVQLFFVLSGFLITGILLQCRSECESNTGHRLRSLRVFYARRCLRIFPVFYATLFIAVFAGIPVARDEFAWHALYLTNMKIALGDRGAWFPLNHFWTLDVEEQFYLLWPWLMLFLKERQLKYAILGFILLGPTTRMLMTFSEIPFDGIRLLPSASFDSLGIGAGLAYWAWRMPDNRRQFRSQTLGLIATLGIITFSSFYLLGTVGRTCHVAGQTMLAITLGWVVWKASAGFEKPWSTLLENPVLTYFGKISYGMYLFHPFCQYSYHWILQVTSGSVIFKHKWIEVPILVIATTATASLSWHLLEKPINNLKHRFPYRTIQITKGEELRERQTG